MHCSTAKIVDQVGDEKEGTLLSLPRTPMLSREFLKYTYVFKNTPVFNILSAYLAPPQNPPKSSTYSVSLERQGNVGPPSFPEKIIPMFSKLRS